MIAGARSAAFAAGVAEVGFAWREGASRLAHLYQRDPLRVLFPTPVAGEPPLAVLVTTSGGLVAGDCLRVAVAVGEDAAAQVTGAAAEKIYRSDGAVTRVAQRLTVGAGAWLEFLPPETILFDGAMLRRETTVSLAAGAGFLGGDILVFGRRARGERLTRGLLREAWEIWRDGALAWGDALHIAGDLGPVIDDPACFAAAAACATLILAPGGQNPRDFIDAARDVQSAGAPDGLRAGVTAVGGVLVARWLGADPATLRRAYAELAGHLREAAMRLPPRLPRLWYV